MRRKLLLLMALSGALLGAEVQVLTGNMGMVERRWPNAPVSVTVTAETTGAWAPKGELLRTSRRPDGTFRCLIDGGTGAAETMAFGNWGGGEEKAGYVYAFSQACVLTGVMVWTQEDKVRSLSELEVEAQSPDGTWVSVGRWRNPWERAERGMVPAALELEHPVSARSFRLRLMKASGRMQMIIGEMLLLGRVASDEESSTLLPANSRPAVSFRVSAVQEQALRWDWREFGQAARGVRGYRLYKSPRSFSRIDEEGVEQVMSLGGDVWHDVLRPVKADEEAWYAVAAEDEAGVYPEVRSQRVRVGKPFECRSFGEMLAMNHYWGGGSARARKETFAPMEAWEEIAIELLGKLGVRQVRWFKASSAVVERMQRLGMGLTPLFSRENFRAGLSQGVLTYTFGNEPDLNGVTPQQYVANLARECAWAKELAPEIRMGAPSSGLERTSLEWLEQAYQAGLKEHVDVLDLHTYCKLGTDFPVPEGYPAGSPEALLLAMPKVRRIMARHGDAARPIIATEFGYSDCLVGNHSGPITRELQAQYLARGLVLHYVLGFSRVYLYSFWDEGEDPDYAEHHFGLLDNNLQAKPAYYAVQTLARVLGACTTFRPVEGLGLPCLGWNFARGAGQVAVLWNGAGESSVTLRSRAHTRLKVISMLGESHEVLTDGQGDFTLRLGPSPVYVESPQSLLVP